MTTEKADDVPHEETNENPATNSVEETVEKGVSKQPEIGLFPKHPIALTPEEVEAHMRDKMQSGGGWFGPGGGVEIV